MIWRLRRRVTGFDLTRIKDPDKYLSAAVRQRKVEAASAAFVSKP